VQPVEVHKMKKLATETLLAMIIFIISGCGHFTSAPTNNVGFVNIEKISDLDGIYKNLGEGGDNSQTFLSKIIWPNSTDITHDDISAIEVRAINVSTIKVTAHSKNGGIVKESNFLAGKDFKISSGQIVIRKDAVFATGFEGAPLLGPVVD
jgi:hypothetical protein